MVRLEVLAGSKTGAVFTGTRFPICAGRAANNDFSFEDDGVWPNHFSIQRQRNELIIQAEANAFLTVNGESIQHATLRNGDVIGVGAARVQFGFTPMRQSSLAWRERLTWVAIAALGFGEVAIAYAIW